MKITYMSDLHLEFGYQALPGGDVLILAGDVAEARSILRNFKAKKVVDSRPDQAFRCWEFFKWECAKYNRVFYIMGNHEHYHGKLDETIDKLRAIMPDNVTILENEVIDHGGIMFLGATLWTDLNKGDDLTRLTLQQSMNDYRVITNKYSDGHYNRLVPQVTAKKHSQTLDYFRSVLAKHRDRKFVVITHHAPTMASISAKYVKDKFMNGGYASDISEFILDHPNISYWIHGHIHDAVDYMVGSTRVISNPRGYVGWDQGPEFDPDAHLAVDD